MPIYFRFSTTTLSHSQLWKPAASLTSDTTENLERVVQALANLPTTFVSATPVQLRDMKAAIACPICRGVQTKYVTSKCCKGLLACTECADRLFVDHTQCPKCLTPNVKDDVLPLVGLDSLFNFIAGVYPSD